MTTDPRCEFAHVREEVSARSGHDICFKQCLLEILAEELTAERAVYAALLNNRNLQATYQKLGISKAELVQAGLLKNPIFSLSYRFSTSSTITDLIDMGIFQNVLEALLIPLKRQAAGNALEATKAMVTAEVLTLIADTKSAFFAYQAAEEVLHLRKMLLLGGEAAHDAARRLYAAGNINELEFAEKQTIHEQAKLEVTMQEIRVVEARERLNVLMGLCGGEISWRASISLPKVEQQITDWGDVECYAIERSLDLESARRMISATAAGYGVDTTRMIFPTIDVGPNSERDDSIWFVGPAIALAIPIFDFGQAVSAAARADIMRQWNHYYALGVEIRATARLARAQTLNSLDVSEFYSKTLVPLADEVTYQTLLQHNAMQLGVFRLLMAKAKEMEQKIMAVESLRDYWMHLTELELILRGHVRIP